MRDIESMDPKSRGLRARGARRLGLILAISLICSTSSNSSALRAEARSINFDDGTAGQAIGDFYLAEGISFSNAAWHANALPGSSPPLVMISENPPFGVLIPPDSPIVATFTASVSVVTIVAIDIGELGIQIDAYDDLVGGSLVATDQILGTGSGVGVFASLGVAATSIRRIEIFQPTLVPLSSDGINLDNLQFDLATQADLELFKDAEVLPGNIVEYTLFVANNGPDTASDVVVDDDLPPCMTYLTDSCGGSNAPAWTWNVGVLPATAETSCTLTLDAAQCQGLIVNTAVVGGAQDDPSPGDETDSAEVLIEGSGAAEIPTLPSAGLLLLILVLGAAATRRLGSPR